MGSPQGSSANGELHHVARMARGSALLVSSGAVSYAGAFALAVLVARSFGKEPFGLWVISVSIGQLLSIFGQLGADWIVVRQGSFYQGIGDEERLRRSIHVALLLAGAGLLDAGLRSVRHGGHSGGPGLPRALPCADASAYGDDDPHRGHVAGPHLRDPGIQGDEGRRARAQHPAARIEISRSSLLPSPCSTNFSSHTRP